MTRDEWIDDTFELVMKSAGLQADGDLLALVEHLHDLVVVFTEARDFFMTVAPLVLLDDLTPRNDGLGRERNVDRSDS